MREVGGGGGRANGPRSDPDYAPNCEVFDHLGYDEIYRGVAQLKPEVLTAGRQAWQGSASGMAEAVQQAHAEIRAAIADGWRGTAADLAAGAVASFEELGRQLSDVMAEVGNRLGQANDAAETLRSALAQPVQDQPDLEAALLDPRRAAANVSVQKLAENLRLDAVRVMNSVYAETFLPTGHNVPAFQDGGMYPVPAVVEGPADPTAPGGGSADVMAPGSVPKAETQPDARTETVRPTATVSNAAAAQPQSVAAPDDAAMVSTPPAATAGVTPVAATQPAAAVAPAAVSVATGSVPTDSPVPQAVSAVETPSGGAVAATAPVAAPVTRAASTESESQRKRADRDEHGDASANAIGGMGAGVVGGLAGGAFAAGGDALRPNSASPVRPKPARLEDEDDEDYYSDFDEPTFLEPSEPGGELVGRMKPTTPPVLGEWAEE